MNRYDLDVQPTLTQRPMHRGAVSKTITYENNTGFPIYVTELSGGHFVLAPSSTTAAEFGIVIYVTYTVFANGANLSGLRDAHSPKQYAQICKELTTNGETTLMYVVDDIGALMRGDLVVLKKLGMAFSTQPVKLDSEVIGKPGGDRKEFALGVVVVQKYEDPAPLKWLRFYTTMLEVEPIRSKYYDEGIYMVIGGAECVEGGKMIMYSFDDPMSPFRAFASEDEARRYRWLDNIPELRDVRAKLEATYQAKLQDLDEKKNRQDLDYRTQLNNLALEKERISTLNTIQTNELKLRSDVRKDQYESRAYQRKDSSEFLKSIPAYLAAGVALVGMIL
ncbi:TPA: hypothetical protein ACP0LB_000188 [Escherichia coli]|nr:hypothetical protein [Salmonella enterica subsp. enterica serovar Havana]EBX7598190.1 hypothetical protein [Salmonella enterica subsp. enterica serovar Virchow]ECD3008240.1 hypothetical protein [Salmonella enterica subsp. enterica]EGO5388083.1 hypothetical protein [Salmonella enterica subsp. enterica serovar Typhimurium]